MCPRPPFDEKAMMADLLIEAMNQIDRDKKRKQVAHDKNIAAFEEELNENESD